MRCVLDCMKIVCRLLVAMAILTVGLVQVSLAAESNDLASAYHRAEQMRAGRVATELSRLSAHAVDAQHLELTQLSIDQSKGSMSFSMDDQEITCHLDAYRCESRSPAAAIPLSIASPDGSRAILAKADNLVLREVKSGAERPLTQLCGE